MEGSILRALMDIFTDYMGMLEKALTGDGIQNDGSRINLAESLAQGISIIANSLTLGQFFSSIVRSAFEDIYHLKFEIDNYILFIQDTHARLKAYLFERVIHKFLSPNGDQRHDSENYIGLQDDSHIFPSGPSVPYQV
jgi:exocyst complex component 8